MSTRCLVNNRSLAVRLGAGAFAALAVLSMASCTAGGARITLVNPTDGTLYVQVNEATPIAIPAKESTTIGTSAAANFGLVTIAARDRMGVLVCFLATSTGSVRRANGTLTLTPNQATVDRSGYPAVGP